MLAAIGAESLDDLFADVPAGLRLERPLDLPAGRSEQEVHEELSGARGAQPPRGRRDELPRGGHVRPLRAVARGRADLSRSEFLTPVHALPARDLAGRPPGDVRVPDGDLGAHRASRGERLGLRGAERRGRRRATWRSSRRAAPGSWPAGPASALARRAAHACRGLRHGGRGGAAHRATAPPTSRALAEAVDDDTAAVFVQQPNFLGTVEDLGELAEAGQAHGGAVRGRRRPAPAGRPAAAGRARRGHLRGRGPDAREPAGLRRPELRLLRRGRALHPPDAGPDRGRDARRGRAARLRAHAADARAAHQAREGHPQHLHRAGAERARRRDLPLLARQARPGGAGGADAAPHALRTRGDRPGGRSTRAPWSASSPCACPTWTGCSSAPAPPASTPATGSGATTPSTRTACSWRSPSAARAGTSTGSPSSWARARRVAGEQAVG